MIIKKLAKAILLSPKEGTIIDSDVINWVSRFTPYGEEIDIYVNDVKSATYDLSFLRDCANS